MKKKWTQYLELAGWIIAILLTFIVPIPFNEYNQSEIRTLSVFENVETSFSKFLAAGIIILSIIPLKRFSAHNHYVIWYFMAIVLLGLSTASYFRYTRLQEDYLIRYPEGQPTIIIKGTVILPDVQEKINSMSVAEHRTIPLPEILKDKGGNADEIWDQKDINNNRRRILLWFYLTICLFTLFLLISYHSCRCFFNNPQALPHENNTTDAPGDPGLQSGAN